MTLDDIRSLDTSGVRRDGYRQGVVAGMSGSAIGGDLLRTLALDEGAVPVIVSRSYRLPAWVGPEALVIASSYSGNTEETLAALDEALRCRASVVCITTGGTMKARAEAEGWPLVPMTGGMQPRAALGYSLTALLTVAEHIGLLKPDAAAWAETQALLEEQAAALADPEAPKNQAMHLAEALNGTLPVVYSSEGLVEAVNLRWRNQMHENSKTLSLGNVVPEMNHSEIMGWARRRLAQGPRRGGAARPRRPPARATPDGCHPRLARPTRRLLDGTTQPGRKQARPYHVVDLPRRLGKPLPGRSPPGRPDAHLPDQPTQRGIGRFALRNLNRSSPLWSGSGGCFIVLGGYFFF